MTVEELIKELKKYNPKEKVAAIVDHPVLGKIEVETKKVSRSDYILGAVYEYGDETRLTRVTIHLGGRVQ